MLQMEEQVIQEVWRTAEVSQVQHIDKIVSVLFWCNAKFLLFKLCRKWWNAASSIL